MTLDALVHTLLVGTARGEPEQMQPPAALATAFATVAIESPEPKLLGQIAMAAAYVTAGRSSTAAPARIPPADDDARPSLSPIASDIFGQLFELPAMPTKHALLAEAFALANRAGHRLPHRLLPIALDYAAGHAAARSIGADLADARGRWLMAQNPAWRIAVSDDADSQSLWSIGSRTERTDLLRRLRQRDAAAGMVLVQSTWGEDGAGDRAAFVDSLHVGLNDGDEVFLEAALDDRSKGVRATAAGLLAKLPSSAYVRRMIERATPLLAFTPPTAGGLLKRGRPARIDVVLPAEFDDAGKRDGLLTAPPHIGGPGQWRLHQLLQRIPPAHWSTTWTTDAAGCVAAAAGDFESTLLSAWAAANAQLQASGHADSDWAAALLRSAAPRNEDWIKQFGALPSADRNALTAELLKQAELSPETAARLINESIDGFDGDAAEAALAFADGVVASSDRMNHYRLAPILDALAQRLPPAELAQYSARWSAERWQPHDRLIDTTLRTLRLRHDLHKELHP